MSGLYRCPLSGCNFEVKDADGWNVMKQHILNEGHGGGYKNPRKVTQRFRWKCWIPSDQVLSIPQQPEQIEYKCYHCGQSFPWDKFEIHVWKFGLGTGPFKTDARALEAQCRQPILLDWSKYIQHPVVNLYSAEFGWDQESCSSADTSNENQTKRQKTDVLSKEEIQRVVGEGIPSKLPDANADDPGANHAPQKKKVLSKD